MNRAEQQCCDHEEHSHLLVHELLHHFPYAIFSIAISLALISLITHVPSNPEQIHEMSDALFHNFHFLHIVFAATGTVITFLRFSSSYLKGVLLGIFFPIIFCSLSDAILPYYGGRLLGCAMTWHICFYDELANVVPFLLVGVINGVVMSSHHYEELLKFSVRSHFLHIFVSSVAATLYLVAHGFTDWSEQMGIVFLFLIGAVLVPCTISDVVVPMIFAKGERGR